MSETRTPEQILGSLKILQQQAVAPEKWWCVLRDWIDHPHSELSQHIAALDGVPLEVTLQLDRNPDIDPSWAAESGPTLSMPATPNPSAAGPNPAASPNLMSADRAAQPHRSTVIGNYKLLQKLGEGGMGTVWMAEQERPVRRRVALKLIKTGLDDQQVLARFEAERQALAMMDHPHIARVLDAGTTDSGQPFFVMELVPGVPLTDYCDTNRLNLQARLELFVPVCQAIQHAHQKGIIHRDLKPSNILVTLHDGQAVAKVIDFGLAKALQQQTKLSERTLFTEFGQVVGTLRYMSPEQAELNALDVDTRADIYSLGVILYELLTGTTPLEREFVSSEPVFRVLAAIRAKDPPRPSSRLSSSSIEAVAGISQQRQIDSRKLQKILKGELDWIAMKALEKDRSRRYATALDLANDLERYLSGQAVQARPPSAAYQLRKLAARHRGSLLASGLVGISLCAGLIGVGWFWARTNQLQRESAAIKQQNVVAEERRLEAERAREEAELARRDAYQQQAKAEAAAQEALISRDEAERANQMANLVARKAQEAEAVAAQREREITNRYSQIMQALLVQPYSAGGTAPDVALTLARRLYTTAQEVVGQDNSDSLVAIMVCGMINLGYPEQAKLALQNALAAARKLSGSPPALARWSHGVAEELVQAGQAALAEPVLRENLQLLATDPKQSWLRGQTQSLLGQALTVRQQYAEAESLLLEAYRELTQDSHNKSFGQTTSAETVERLITLYSQWQRDDQVARWRQVAAAGQSAPLSPAK